MTKLRIFIVDDETGVRNTLRRCIPDHDVTVFASAEEALVYLRDSASPRPDLILTDTNMSPGMFGPQFLRAVREEALAPEAYCVIMSGAEKLVAQTAIDAGDAHEFVSKPWTTERLEQILRNAQMLRRARDGEVVLMDGVNPVRSG